MLESLKATMSQVEVPRLVKDRKTEELRPNPDFPAHLRCKAGHVAPTGSRFFLISGATVPPRRQGVYCEHCLLVANKMRRLARHGKTSTLDPQEEGSEMVNMDVDSAIVSGTETDQKRDGTHKEHFAQLMELFKELEAAGADTGDRYRQMCFTLLKSFEGVRLEQEGHIKDYTRKIAFCRAKQQSCSMFANMLVGLLGTQVQETKRAEQVKGNGAPTKLADGTERVSEEEMLQRVCICGCVDDEDAKNCDCSCHQGVPCDDGECVVCQAKKAQVVAQETTGRRKRK